MCAEAWQHSFRLSFFDKTPKRFIKNTTAHKSVFFLLATQQQADRGEAFTTICCLQWLGPRGVCVCVCVCVCVWLGKWRRTDKIHERKREKKTLLSERRCAYLISQTDRKSLPSVHTSPFVLQSDRRMSDKNESETRKTTKELTAEKWRQPV